MLLVLCSAILFGLIHPGSKLILSSGISVLSFCIFYIAIRLIFQIPLAVRRNLYSMDLRSQLGALVSIGLVGAALQFTEFFGIKEGLPVSTVSFLVFTHPIWILFLGTRINAERITISSMVKVILASLGVTFILNPSYGNTVPLSLATVPLMAGFLIALWVTLANRVRKKGCTSKAISFYYDLFALMALLLIASALESSSLVVDATILFKDPKFLILMVFYSVLIGLVPNLLFYQGSKQITSLSAGFLLLLEPIIATMCGILFWGEILSERFAFGAALILAVNAPVLRVLSSLRRYMRKALLTSLALSISSTTLASGEQSIHIIEVVPSDSSSYTVAAEMRQMNAAFILAEQTFRREFPTCKLKIHRTVKYGSESELHSIVREIAKKYTSDLLVGFSRSIFARTAAKAAAGTRLQGIAIGASTTNLKKLNENFVSIAAPRTSQWKEITKQMKGPSGCIPGNTAAIVDLRDNLSRQFKDDYLKEGFERVYDTSEEIKNKKLSTDLNKVRCLFIALNFSDAQAHLEHLLAKKWRGTVFGIGDWNMFTSEFRNLLRNAPYRGLISYIPTGWTPDINDRSRVFSEKLEALTASRASPVGAYSYDALIVAMGTLCLQSQVAIVVSLPTVKKLLLRDYNGISSSRNFLSNMLLLKIESGI